MPIWKEKQERRSVSMSLFFRYKTLVICALLLCIFGAFIAPRSTLFTPIVTTDAPEKRVRFVIQAPPSMPRGLGQGEFTETSQGKAREQKVLKRFNPDTASIETWELFGFSAKQAQTIIRYRTKIGGFQYKDRLANCFVIGEKGYKRLEPYIALPSKYDAKRGSIETHSAPELFLFNPDTASAATFQTLGFSARQAGVLIHFREALGGRFGSVEQFSKSYVVDSATLERLRPYMVFE